MTSKFWLYLGIILACSGIGTGLGIVLIILYVWGDINQSINNITNSEYTSSEKTNSKYYSQDTMEEMK